MEATVTISLTEFDNMRRKIESLTDEIKYLNTELDLWKMVRPDLCYIKPDDPKEKGYIRSKSTKEQS